MQFFKRKIKFCKNIRSSNFDVYKGRLKSASRCGNKSSSEGHCKDFWMEGFLGFEEALRIERIVGCRYGLQY